MTERVMGDPLAAFDCPKCGGITIQPRLEWHQVSAEWTDGPDEYITVWCADCAYSERRPTKDAVVTDPALAGPSEKEERELARLFPTVYEP